MSLSIRIFPALILLVFGACNVNSQETDADTDEQRQPRAEQRDAFARLPDSSEVVGLEVATFAGGCFWCTEAVFERVAGVKEVISGYAGGQEPDPTYEEVSRGRTDHAETIQIYYDPEEVTFAALLDVFFGGAHDPTQVDRQGPDVGPQYRSIAFYRNPQEKEAIETNIAEWERKYGEPIATEVKPFEIFYPAENYHQDYYPANQDNPYIQKVSKPKVEKFEKRFPRLLKEDFQ